VCSVSSLAQAAQSSWPELDKVRKERERRRADEHGAEMLLPMPETRKHLLHLPPSHLPHLPPKHWPPAARHTLVHKPFRYAQSLVTSKQACECRHKGLLVQSRSVREGV